MRLYFKSSETPEVIRVKTTRLMSCGKLMLSPHDGTKQITVTVQRGMTLLSLSGEELGKLAAVVENSADEVSALLLVCSGQGLEYRLIPASLINEVAEGVITLTLTKLDVASLPIHNPDC